ncbi:MAG: cytochrome c oxidase subunit II [Candidatus Omnitrophica bacterium]|nr:cytochrome c oxidase subunit II [Candidatus Omnitrophota bacterium]
MEKYYGWGLPIDISTHGYGIDRIIHIMHAAMALLFIGWFVFLIYVLFRFRARKHPVAIHDVKHFKFPTIVEVGVAVFEAILLAAFSFPIWVHLHDQLPSKEKALEVRVVAEQFAWNIHYPGRDGVFGRTDAKMMDAANPLGLDKADPAAADDVTTINQMHVPVDKPILAHLSAKDVIHSFYLPVMRIKQDAVPGQSIPVWFQAKATGDFEIACAQLCGLGHYRMKGYFVVDTPDKFDAWFLENEPKLLK